MGRGELAGETPGVLVGGLPGNMFQIFSMIPAGLRVHHFPSLRPFWSQRLLWAPTVRKNTGVRDVYSEFNISGVDSRPISSQREPKGPPTPKRAQQQGFALSRMAVILMESCFGQSSSLKAFCILMWPLTGLYGNLGVAFEVDL